jgi:hypothetical protein
MPWNIFRGWQLLSRRVDGLVVIGRHRDPRTPIPDLSLPGLYVLAESEDS